MNIPVGGGWNRTVQVFNSGDHDKLFFLVWWMKSKNYYPYPNDTMIEDLRIYKVVTTSVEAPPLVSALGWDGTDFTMDFFLNFDDEKQDTDYSEDFQNMMNKGQFTLNIYREDGDDPVIEQELNIKENHGVSIKPKNTNVIYSAEMYVDVDDLTYASDEVPSESIYSLVMSAIYKGDFAEQIDAAQLAKVNEVLENGGLYLRKVETPAETPDEGDPTEARTEWMLTPETQLVMSSKTVSNDDGSSTVTVTLTDKAKAAGLSFTDNITSSDGMENESEGGLTTKVQDSSTVIITIPADPVVLEASVLNLESVSLEFAPVGVAEAEAESAGTELDLVTEL